MGEFKQLIWEGLFSIMLPSERMMNGLFVENERLRYLICEEDATWGDG